MNVTKIIKATAVRGRTSTAAPIIKEDYGLYLQIEGVELPSTYEVDFSNSEHNGTSVTMIGNADGVLIPHQFIDTGKDVFAFLYHVGADYGRTVYKFRIPNKVRPDRTDIEPTPAEQSTIDQLIGALNSAVEQTGQDAESASQSAQSAESAKTAAESARDTAGEYANDAHSSAESASESARVATEKATASAQSASQSAQIKADVEVLVDDAQSYAESALIASQASVTARDTAQGYAQSASGYASSAQTSAQTASMKASEAVGYVETATQKATEASQSASQALGYRNDAESAKTASQTAQGLAESARDSAVQAKTDAESAKADAESARDAVQSSAAQITTNAEDIIQLKEDLNYYAVSKNLLGLEANTLYPCYIPNGSKITISTKDGSAVNDNAVVLDLWKQDKTRSDFWGISGYSSRTITVIHDIYYVSIRKAWSVPLQVEKGNTATAFEDWFLSARHLTQELDDINENTKVLSVADRANLLNELETHYVTGYLDISNGQINSNNNYYTEITNYILVNVGEKYLYSGLCGTSIAGACFYDENFSYISGVGGDAVTPVIKEITIPNNTKYVRFASFHNRDTIVSKLLVSKKQDNIIHINNLTHKEWYACGDSYTEGAYVFDGYNPSDKWLTSGKYANLLKCYPYYIGNRTNCNVHNIALSGSTLAKVTNDDYSFSYQKYTTIPNTADYITLWFGINDKAQNVPIGNDTDSVNTTFKGAWNIVLAYLLEHCPKAHIGIIVSNSLSQSYVDATIAMAERWGVPYLDLNSDNVPLMQNTLRNVSDDAKAIAISKFAISSTNMHPNYWAHEFESYFIEDFLKRI